MENRPQIPLAEQYAAALDWWREAGVDCAFDDHAQALLAEPEIAAKPQPKAQEAGQPAEAQLAIDPASLPGDLAAFGSWWTDPASPLPAAPGPRLALRGEPGAELMFLVPMPEAGDRETLLEGPQGVMLANICRALQIAPQTACFAAALPAHLPLPDWNVLAAEGLGGVIRHHVTLARPARVLVMGNDLLPLLGHDRDAPPESFDEIAGIPALATFAPDRLLDHPRQRARLWQRLLDWTAP